MPAVNLDPPAAEAGPLTRTSRAPFGPRDAWNYLLQWASLALFYGCGLCVTLLAPLVRLVCGAERTPIVGRAMIRGLFRFFAWWLQWTGLFKIRFEGLEKLDRLSGCIVAPNHPGLLDAVFLIPRLPRAVCIMRGGLMRNPSFSGAARLAGYITNDRGAEMIRECEGRLRAGENLLIFPEGTRTRAHARGVNPFKSGFALAAVLTGAPIQTVFIERSGVYLGKETSLARAAEIPIRMTIRLGEVFTAQPGETAKRLSARLEAYFRSHLENGEDGVRLRD